MESKANAGFGLVLLTHWLAGEMVYRFHVGTHEGADVNAKKSPSQRNSVGAGRVKQTISNK